MTHDPADNLYDTDFYAWTQQQAELLRRLPPSDAVDIAHVAEEIEDMGKRDLRDVISSLRRLLDYLIRLWAVRESAEAPHWASEVYRFQFDAEAAFSPSMRQLLDIADIWREARRFAGLYLRDIGRGFESPAACPFSLDALLSRDFEIDAALARLAAAQEGMSADASDGPPQLDKPVDRA